MRKGLLSKTLYLIPHLPSIISATCWSQSLEPLSIESAVISYPRAVQKHFERELESGHIIIEVQFETAAVEKILKISKGSDAKLEPTEVQNFKKRVEEKTAADLRMASKFSETISEKLLKGALLPKLLSNPSQLKDVHRLKELAPISEVLMHYKKSYGLDFSGALLFEVRDLALLLRSRHAHAFGLYDFNENERIIKMETSFPIGGSEILLKTEVRLTGLSAVFQNAKKEVFLTDVLIFLDDTNSKEFKNNLVLEETLVHELRHAYDEKKNPDFFTQEFRSSEELAILSGKELPQFTINFPVLALYYLSSAERSAFVESVLYLEQCHGFSREQIVSHFMGEAPKESAKYLAPVFELYYDSVQKN